MITEIASSDHFSLALENTSCVRIVGEAGQSFKGWSCIAEIESQECWVIGHVAVDRAETIRIATTNNQRFHQESFKKHSPIGGKSCWHCCRAGLILPTSITAFPRDLRNLRWTFYLDPSISAMYGSYKWCRNGW